MYGKRKYRYPDLYWMEEAIRIAKNAPEDCIPVGAILVRNNQIISAAHNNSDVFAHAEMLVIKNAVENYDKYLNDCILYSTLEPCDMCIGAAKLVKIPKIIFGAYKIDDSINIEKIGGIREYESYKMLSIFFKNLRKS